MSIKIKLPTEVEYIIDTLGEKGFEAYAVGGCVRDSILGKQPHDWDVCTSALSAQVISCFAGQRVIETGLQHGTVTLMLNEKPFEVTTFRVDGEYTDNRRPDEVEFVRELKSDLARRDFTCNAMAYNLQTGLVDYYGGQRDLAAGIIKCVGDANKRFQEDALRIMRALRFAAVLGFSIDDDTAKAMHNNRALLGNIAAERIAAELNKLIMGDNLVELLSAHFPVLAEIIPELGPTVGFEQNNPYHCYDVLTHTLASVDAAPKDLQVRLTMLFHDIGKPKNYSQSEDGIGHFYGHAELSSLLAHEILLRLKYDNDMIRAVMQLVLYHDAEIAPRRKHIKRWLNKIGEVSFRQLLEVKRADAMAQSEKYQQGKLGALDAVLPILDEIIAERQCFSLKDLAVNGRDLIAAGVPQGTAIGAILNRLLEMVVDEEAENDRAVLLEAASELISFRGAKNV